MSSTRLLKPGRERRTREPRQTLYCLEDTFDPTLGRHRRFPGDVLVDALKVPQCPWRQERPGEGTWLGIVA